MGADQTNFDTHQFAAQAHAGQVDKGGKPYIRHIDRVAAAADKRARHAPQVDGLEINPDYVLQAAYLHGVVEDTKIVPEGLVRAGYAAEIIEMVHLLTKTDEPMNYAERIAALIETRNLRAILIKLSDNEDNASMGRQFPNKDGLTARYAASMPRLKDAAAALGFTGS